MECMWSTFPAARAGRGEHARLSHNPLPPRQIALVYMLRHVASFSPSLLSLQSHGAPPSEIPLAVGPPTVSSPPACLNRAIIAIL